MSYYYPYYPYPYYTYFPHYLSSVALQAEGVLRRSRLAADIAASRAATEVALRRSRIEAEIATEDLLRRSRI
jgi:hypothetical protein